MSTSEIALGVVEAQYCNMVKKLTKTGVAISEHLSVHQIEQWHMATGLAGEAGEVLDLIKKSVIYQKSLDIDKLIKEMGDVEYYMEGLRQSLGIGRQEVLTANMEKLADRYKGFEYSDEQAIAQRDMD